MFHFDSNLTKSWSPQQSMPSTPASPLSPMLGIESEFSSEYMEKPTSKVSQRPMYTFYIDKNKVTLSSYVALKLILTVAILSQN